MASLDIKFGLTFSEADTIVKALKLWRSNMVFNTKAIRATKEEQAEAWTQIGIAEGILRTMGADIPEIKAPEQKPITGLEPYLAVVKITIGDDELEDDFDPADIAEHILDAAEHSWMATGYEKAELVEVRAL